MMTGKATSLTVGVGNLRFCDQLEEADLLDCNLGDGAIAVLAGKTKMRRIKTGRSVSDDGLGLLHSFPAFKTWSEGGPEYGLMSFGAEPTNLLVMGHSLGKGCWFELLLGHEAVTWG